MNNKSELLDEFVKYFNKEENTKKKGTKFEKFCQIFLQWLGYDDIKLTGKTGDGGVDLTCSQIDKLGKNKIDYVIQAKCYTKTNKVNGEVIAALKGRKNVPISTRRICITTSDFTNSAKEEANDKNIPVFLINGEDIIKFLMDDTFDKVFDVHYEFNSNKMDDVFLENNIEINGIDKNITKNDVRARILRFPTEYKCLFMDKNKFLLSVNGTEAKYYNIDKRKTFFGGVTNLYKNFISNLYFEGAISTWKYDEKKQIMYVTIH